VKGYAPQFGHKLTTERKCSMAKKPTAKKSASKKGPTSARLLKNRPVDPEPPEVSPDSQEPAEESDGKKRPRQARLPEMEDPAIEELESAAEQYAEIRDRRQELTTEEVRLKTQLLNIMHENKKTEYNHGGVNVKVLVEKEKVRVRIKKDED
jgi:hypothetical protein